ncbi:RsmB/NOP family class I SAM-dependent RNA methyltransferase [Hoeflea prorocentri]|uniref:RsmB/NOP family class I SAM-dependent RNA methyltransferase n=1 Tax=Hoeflea prorocentri TaxID=1922333 RepID=A0A9X3UL19_9HYPH|nr:RsmB/NOP family class I SAM-dependent RNA methyltransferase [Hoeflea prorocentri]MCY6383222.1 RsmB/NOP family class I SAM-dependent RNA methyltransferase [Hoeflea prorocentri]MDA5401022.1 RsmB/NOP family class I SAM-dependent RNA methyltransferase [Hoeflea prorocentri]
MNKTRLGSRPKSHSPDSKPGLAARKAATRLLSTVVDKKTSLDGLLDPAGGNPAFRALEPVDRSLVRAILLSALRHRCHIEAALSQMLDRPLPAGARALSHLLHVAAAQILYLDVPDRAAVDLAVEQAQSDPRNRRFAALVNAVLRRLAREKEKLLPRIVSSTRNAPAWFIERLSAAYGDRVEAILAAHATEPPLDLTTKQDPEIWADRLGGIVLPTGSVRLPALKGPLTELPGFAEGQWWVQDAAASIPARLFGRIDGQRVADLCAAPGGKTAQLALAGAKVTAVDLSHNRLGRLRENLERLGLEAQCVQTNVLDWQPEEPFDAVLLDAPCSSTGTVRRHPDIPWTKSLEDIEKLAALQERLLRHALTLVRSGGVVVFSNCSLDPLEGEAVVQRVLTSHPQAVRLPVKAQQWSGLEGMVTAAGDIRTTPDMLPDDNPQLSGMDGFFACVIARPE